MGCYSSELEACKALAKALGVPVDKLKRKGVMTRNVARRLFKAAHRVFKKYVPGDLEKTNQCEITCQAVFRKDWFAVTCSRTSFINFHIIALRTHRLSLVV